MIYQEMTFEMSLEKMGGIIGYLLPEGLAEAKVHNILNLVKSLSERRVIRALLFR